MSGSAIVNGRMTRMLREEFWGDVEDLREYAARMHVAERIARFGVFRWELATGRVRWSDELHRIYGLEAGAFEGTVQAFLQSVHPEDRQRVRDSIERCIQDGSSYLNEQRIIRPDGEQRTLLARGCTVNGPDGRAQAIVGVCTDITERMQAQRALGLSERRMRAILDYTPSIVAVKDLDGRYLMSNAETGRVLGRSAEEVIGRYCTELFPQIAEQLRENDRLAAAEMEPVYDETVLIRDGEPRDYVTVTFALPDDDGQPVETCTIATDVTERKERDSERRAKADWRQRIELAIAEKRMLAYAQPVIDVVCGEVRFCELLVRKQLRSGELLAPAAFLPAAERFGLVQMIDEWMVGRALELSERFCAAVNLSAVTLCDEQARRRIIERLRGSRQRSSRLIFEITETADPEHLDAARAFAEDLTALGCGLALDDFGVGFGSFTYLRTLSLAYLKIDRSFIAGLLSSRDDRRIVESIIGIARQFDLRLVAEGIEDQRTLELVRELGVDCAQGFHLALPAPAEDELSPQVATGR